MIWNDLVYFQIKSPKCQIKFQSITYFQIKSLQVKSNLKDLDPKLRFQIKSDLILPITEVFYMLYGEAALDSASSYAALSRFYQ
jgi:hypothetical protein